MSEHESTTLLRDGAIPRFRRFALVSPPATVLAQETVPLSNGGADHLEHEARDVDGDGRSDLVFFYVSRHPVGANTAGFVAATSPGQLIHAPMWTPVSTGVEKNATGCWARIEGTPALVLLWSAWSIGGEDGDTHLGWSSSAYTVGNRGAIARTLYGVVVAQGDDLAALTSVIPPQHLPFHSREEWTPLAPDCSRSATPVLAVGEPPGRLSLISGVSFAAEKVGSPCPIRRSDRSDDEPKRPEVKVPRAAPSARCETPGRLRASAPGGRGSFGSLVTVSSSQRGPSSAGRGTVGRSDPPTRSSHPQQ